jgi:hypothetical protein
MTPDKNQPSTIQNEENINEPVSHQQAPQHRPDWIIPDNGISSKNTNRSGKEQNSQQDNSIPMDNDETLGIP